MIQPPTVGDTIAGRAGDGDRYALYYQPYTRSGKTTGMTLQAAYTPTNATADPAWRAANNLTDAVLQAGTFRNTLPQVKSNQSEPAASFWVAKAALRSVCVWVVGDCG